MLNNNKIAIIGAGSFGREVFHLLDDSLYECVGFIDYNEKAVGLSVSIIGNENDIAQLIDKYNFSNCAITIGNIKKRNEIHKKIKEVPLSFPNIIDSSAKCYSKDIGDGSILYPGVVIMNNCKIGLFTILNSGVTLGHDVTIGNFCNINPGVHLAGNITIGNYTLIGIGASIKEEITIGSNAIIGAGSVVINDIPNDTTVYGVPAKTASS